MDDGDFYSLTPEDVDRINLWQGAPPDVPADAPHSYDTINMSRVEWTIPGLVPRGMLTVVAGLPGLGKSMLGIYWCAALSRESRPSIFVTAEDAPQYTVKPRLLAAQAQTKYVYAPPYLPVFNGAVDSTITGLRFWIEYTSAELLVFDPIVAMIDAAHSSHNDQHVRRVLGPLSDLAQETNCAVVYVMHFNKGAQSDMLYRIGGSVGFGAAARSAVILGVDPDDEEARIVVHEKCNVAEKKRPHERYVMERIVVPHPDGGPDVSSACLRYAGTSELTSAQVFQSGDEEERTEVQRACDTIMDLLGEGEMLSDELRRAMLEMDVSEKTYRRARTKLGLEAFQRDRKWYSRVTSQMATREPVDNSWPSESPVSEPNEGVGEGQVANPREWPPEEISTGQGVSQSLYERGGPEWLYTASAKEIEEYKREVLDTHD